MEGGSGGIEMEKMMDGEMSNLMMVWTTVGGTMWYCHAVGRAIPEGKARLIAILPAVVVLLLLPLRLTSIHLGGPSSFFIGWLSTFKLLLFAFAKGPLSSNPPLSLSQFLPLACLPIKLHHTPIPNKSPLTFTYASTAMIIIFSALIPLYGKSESVNPKLVLFLYSLHMYIGLEFIYSIISMATRKVLKVQLEPQFDEPYLSTSLQDFWGRRWNIMVNRVLHPTVYEPVASASTRLIGRKWAPLPAILATFSVSAMMHELVFYYIKRESRAWEPWEPSWDATCFFLLHGACLALEVAVKRELRGKTKWRVPRVVTSMLTVVFVIYTALSLFVPALVRCRVYEKATREIAAITEFGKEVYALLRQRILWQLIYHLVVPMEAKKQAVAVQVQVQVQAPVQLLLLLLLLLMASPILSCPPSSGGRDDCKECIVSHMSNDCPSCTPILHCMARCLWGGDSSPHCINNCNNNGYPTLSDCKRCMSPCKCSCAN